MISIFLLSFIQGITEFLPISSSAHLIIFRDLFLIGRNIINSDIELIFDIALHFGTLLAILFCFYKDLINIVISGFTKGLNDNEGKIMWFIIIATIPVVLIGLLFEDLIENIFRSKYLLIALSLIIVGIIIYKIDIKKEQTKSLDKMNIKDALLIGIGQIFALIPGFSRSGTTISTSRLLKINREDSTKFSFYLSVPVILGITIYKTIKEGFLIINNNLNVFLIGVFVSFIVGVLCIKMLLRYVKNNDFKLFMWYRIIFGLLIILFLIKRG